MFLPALRSFASLYQHPPDSWRTEEQNALFKLALGVMGDLYASVIGTMVLRCTEIPPRPTTFDGALCLFGLAEGSDEATIRSALTTFGNVVSCQVGCGMPPAVVYFSTHEEALAAKRAATQLKHICDGIDTLYNERSYGGRRGEDGRDDDEGRGWCGFEDSVSSEQIIRLQGYPKMQAVLRVLPPKMLSRFSHGGFAPEAQQVAGHLARSTGPPRAVAGRRAAATSLEGRRCARSDDAG